MKLAAKARHHFQLLKFSRKNSLKLRATVSVALNDSKHRSLRTGPQTGVAIPKTFRAVFSKLTLAQGIPTAVWHRSAVQASNRPQDGSWRVAVRTASE